DDLAIDGFDSAIRSQDPKETGDSVNYRAQASFAFTQCLFRPFSLGQIDDECNGFTAAFFEQRDANKYRNSAAVFAKILLVERFRLISVLLWYVYRVRATPAGSTEPGGRGRKPSPRGHIL